MTRVAGACGIPFLLMGNVLTAALLGSKDSVSPLVAMVASASTNVVLDVVAVGVFRKGVVGAALATTIAQIVSCVVLAFKASSKLDGRAGTPAPVAYLGRLCSRSAPRLRGKSFATFAGPVLVLVFSKLLSFGVMTHSSARLGALPLAAHQLAFTLYLLASLVLDAMAGQTAQAFLPPLIVKRARVACRRLAAKLGKLSALSAVVVSASAFALATFGAPLFSSDPAIASALKSLAPPLAACVLVHGAIAHGEGILLASSDLKFVGGAYAASATVFPPAIFHAIKTKTMTQGSHVWNAFVLFQLFRATIFQLRAKHVLSKRADDAQAA